MPAWTATPAIVSVGDFETASLWNTQVNGLGASLQAANIYTPAWTASTTNPVIGNGIIVGYYWQIGKLVLGSWRIVPGSTSTFGTGNYTISLPVTTSSRYGSEDTLGVGLFRHQATATRYALSMFWSTTTSMVPLYLNATANPIGMTSSGPVTPAATDAITGQFMYESA